MHIISCLFGSGANTLYGLAHIDFVHWLISSLCFGIILSGETEKVEYINSDGVRTFSWTDYTAIPRLPPSFLYELISAFHSFVCINFYKFKIHIKKMIRRGKYISSTFSGAIKTPPNLFSCIFRRTIL